MTSPTFPAYIPAFALNRFCGHGSRSGRNLYQSIDLVEKITGDQASIGILLLGLVATIIASPDDAEDDSATKIASDLPNLEKADVSSDSFRRKSMVFHPIRRDPKKEDAKIIREEIVKLLKEIQQETPPDEIPSWFKAASDVDVAH
ncbi:unnamed protein product [Caenorhabditis auriculariae]|uniref:Uncharacterized protein n=1 Tax=Caenorhabditis auriculariae TaxID=2777116 RepID=A0A8S1HBS9_9PELO|nr:unnamed protein product [Caenorhabditis auriculariae]